MFDAETAQNKTWVIEKWAYVMEEWDHAGWTPRM